MRERRRHPRSDFELDVQVRSESAGVVPGRGLDISDSGMAIILPVELRVGEIVDLEFKKSGEAHRTRASVRHRNVFRHGLEFLSPSNSSRLRTFAKFVWVQVLRINLQIQRALCP